MERKRQLLERVCNRRGEQIDDGLLQCVTKEILELMKDYPQEAHLRASRRSD